MASLGGLASLVGLPSTASNGQMMIGILQGDTVVDAIIDKFKLMEEYEQEIRLRARTATLKNLEVNEDTKSGLISVAFLNEDPQRAADIANAFVEELRKKVRDLAFKDAQQKREFFESQLLQAQQELNTAEAEMINYQQSSGVIELGSQTGALLASINSLRNRIAAKNVEISTLSSYARKDNPRLKLLQSELDAMTKELRSLEEQQSRQGRGSNSDLLDDDKERVLGGRTLSFRIMPFTFSEYYNYRTELNNGVSRNADDEFVNYMRWGGFPLIFGEKDDNNRQVMLESIFDSIVLRDIVTKLKLKNSYQLERVLDYVIASTGSYISGRSIAEKLDEEKTDSASLPKILEYLHGIEKSCIIDVVPRFDVIGLKVLEFNNKSYTCDPAFINYKKSLISDLYGSIFETIVYNELIARGYTVRTGSVYGKEIDFVAMKKQTEKIYIQVAYEITDHNREREFGNFSKIQDNYPKYVISRDKIPLSQNGIIHRNIVDFLLDS